MGRARRAGGDTAPPFRRHSLVMLETRKRLVHRCGELLWRSLLRKPCFMGKTWRCEETCGVCRTLQNMEIETPTVGMPVPLSMSAFGLKASERHQLSEPKGPRTQRTHRYALNEKKMCFLFCSWRLANSQTSMRLEADDDTRRQTELWSPKREIVLLNEKTTRSEY